MAQVATKYFFVNPKHTGGYSILSDIVVSIDRIGFCHAANDGCEMFDDGFFDEDDDDFDDMDDGLEFATDDMADDVIDLDDELAALLLWRGPKRDR